MTATPRTLDALARIQTPRLARSETEAGYMQVVIEWARWRGWLVYHTHDSRHSTAGYPDLTLVRRGRLIFAELKTDRARRLRADQAVWLETLADAPVEVYVWRPADWDQVRELLR